MRYGDEAVESLRATRVVSEECTLANILDAIDGYFGPDVDVRTVPGRRLLEFGEEVRRFEGAVSIPETRSGIPYSYLGGWPSANVWLVQNSPVVMSCLLYSTGAIASDPVLDWFSHHRYRRPQVMGARPGYLNDDGEPDVAATRQFLSTVIPALDRLRPLIESGALQLVPTQRLLWEYRDETRALASDVLSALGPDPDAFTQRFRPSELARADNLKGLFAFVGGNREKQVSQAIAKSVGYFTEEYTISRLCDALYMAPYRFEQYLCSEGLGAGVRERPGGRVLDALTRSSLPVFGGLTPKLLAEIRDHEAFGNFRSELYATYARLPSRGTPEELESARREAEEALLDPRIDAVRRVASAGALASVLRVLDIPLRLTLGIAVSAAGPFGLVPQAAAATGSSAATKLLDRLLRRPDGSGAVWATLDRHSQRVERHVENTEQRAGDLPSVESYWGIPQQPSMSVHMSEGLLVSDWLPRTKGTSGGLAGSSERPYGPCPCGSGHKWKFCCK